MSARKRITPICPGEKNCLILALYRKAAYYHMTNEQFNLLESSMRNLRALYFFINRKSRKD